MNYFFVLPASIVKIKRTTASDTGTRSQVAQHLKPAAHSDTPRPYAKHVPPVNVGLGKSSNGIIYNTFGMFSGIPKNSNFHLSYFLDNRDIVEILFVNRK